MTRTALNRPPKATPPAEPVPQLPTWGAQDISDALLVFLDSLSDCRSSESEEVEISNPLDDGASNFSILAEVFGLSPFERGLLMLAMISEMHPLRFRTFWQQHYDREQLPVPGCVSRHLALSVFNGDPTALTNDAPLLHWQFLLYRNEREQHSLAPLHIDPAVLAYVYGDKGLNPRLSRYVQNLDADPDAIQHTKEKRVPEIIAHFNSGQRATVQLHGRDLSSQADLAQAALAHLGRPIIHLSLGALLDNEAQSERDLLLWERETRLRPLCFSMDAHLSGLNLDPERWPAGRVERSVAAIVGQLHAPLVLLTEEPMNLGSGRPALSLEVARPSRAEQRDMWARALGVRDAQAGRLRELCDQFDLSARTLRSLAQNARLGAGASSSDAELLERAWEACRVAGRQRIGKLAERLTGGPGWDDVVLPAADLAVLHQLVEHVRHRTQVYETWGMGRHARGLGISALFSGPSGTGKTLAAEVIAGELRLDLYRIDISSMVSKYIGETEKNLKQIFDAADDGGVILLFDEADSLFGKRGDVQSANDRYANTQVNYLLQRMESYAGLALLTTNLESGMDVAFMRRIRFVLNFRPPEAPERERIWRRAFPKQVEVGGVDFEKLARVKLAGGNIRSVALGAAFMAAARGRPLDMAMLREAIQGEWRKLGRVSLEDAAFAGW